MTYAQRRHPHMIAAVKHANKVVSPNREKRNGSGRTAPTWTEATAFKWNREYHTELERSWRCST